MNGGLDSLTEADIRARCTEASFERGWNYYTGGAVRQHTRLDDGIETRVAGTHTYRVTVREAPGWQYVISLVPVLVKLAGPRAAVELRDRMQTIEGLWVR